MKKTLNIGGRILDLSEPKIMGIINLTPDSFYEKSRSMQDFRHKVESMIDEGADILDLGACSTRPGAKEVNVNEEIDRLMPTVMFLKVNYPHFPVSVDTFRSTVAKEVLNHHSCIINDVSGGTLDDNMWNTVADAKVPYILMHMRGNPNNMQDKEHLNYDDVTLDVFKDLHSKSVELLKKGVKDIIIDPGIGFAKDIDANFKLISNLSYFKTMEFPLLVGLSRKSFISKSLKTNTGNALNGTSVLHTISLMKGASILRVHDVKEALEVKSLINLLNLA
jgi:dihydropteroate synthase